METDEIKGAIRNFLGGFVRAKEFKDSDNIFELGFINSMFVMQLVLFVEKKFSLSVENKDLDIVNFSSIDALSGFVATKLNGGRL